MVIWHSVYNRNCRFYFGFNWRFTYMFLENAPRLISSYKNKLKWTKVRKSRIFNSELIGRLDYRKYKRDKKIQWNWTLYRQKHIFSLYRMDHSCRNNNSWDSLCLLAWPQFMWAVFGFLDNHSICCSCNIRIHGIQTAQIVQILFWVYFSISMGFYWRRISEHSTYHRETILLIFSEFSLPL